MQKAVANNAHQDMAAVAESTIKQETIDYQYEDVNHLDNTHDYTQSNESNTLMLDYNTQTQYNDYNKITILPSDNLIMIARNLYMHDQNHIYKRFRLNDIDDHHSSLSTSSNDTFLRYFYSTQFSVSNQDNKMYNKRLFLHWDLLRDMLYDFIDKMQVTQGNSIKLAIKKAPTMDRRIFSEQYDCIAVCFVEVTSAKMNSKQAELITNTTKRHISSLAPNMLTSLDVDILHLPLEVRQKVQVNGGILPLKVFYGFTFHLFKKSKEFSHITTESLINTISDVRIMRPPIIIDADLNNQQYNKSVLLYSMYNHAKEVVIASTHGCIHDWNMPIANIDSNYVYKKADDYIKLVLGKHLCIGWFIYALLTCKEAKVDSEEMDEYTLRQSYNYLPHGMLEKYLYKYEFNKKHIQFDDFDQYTAFTVGKCASEITIESCPIGDLNKLLFNSLFNNFVSAVENYVLISETLVVKEDIPLVTTSNSLLGKRTASEMDVGKDEIKIIEEAKKHVVKIVRSTNEEMAMVESWVPNNKAKKTSIVTDISKKLLETGVNIVPHVPTSLEKAVLFSTAGETAKANIPKDISDFYETIRINNTVITLPYVLINNGIEVLKEELSSVSNEESSTSLESHLHKSKLSKESRTCNGTWTISCSWSDSTFPTSSWSDSILPTDRIPLHSSCSSYAKCTTCSKLNDKNSLPDNQGLNKDLTHVVGTSCIIHYGLPKHNTIHNAECEAEVPNLVAEYNTSYESDTNSYDGMMNDTEL